MCGIAAHTECAAYFFAVPLRKPKGTGGARGTRRVSAYAPRELGGVKSMLWLSKPPASTVPAEMLAYAFRAQVPYQARHFLRRRAGDRGLLGLFAGLAWRDALGRRDARHSARPAIVARAVSDLVRSQGHAAVLSLAAQRFWIEHKLWGDATLGYHLVNISLHALVALMVAVVLRQLAIPGAFLAAAIFALHPVHVESVAWISEQKNTLSAVFYLGAAMAYLRFDQSRDKRLYAAALTLFLLGLLSKTVIATLPAALLLVFWWRRGRLTWRNDVLPLLPFFAFGAVAGVLTACVERILIWRGGGGVRVDLRPALFDCRPRGLVLFQNADLAVRVDVHLSLLAC